MLLLQVVICRGGVALNIFSIQHWRRWDFVDSFMKQVTVRRTFPRNRFCERVLLDWKESVDDRNVRSVLSRALINLKAYPLDIATFAELKDVRGIGNHIARKLEGAWDVFCSQHLTTPTVAQIDQMKKGDFLQFVISANFLEQRSGPRITTASRPLPPSNAPFVVETKINDLIPTEKEEVGIVRSRGTRKRPPKTVQPPQPSKIEAVGCGVLSAVNEPCCSGTDRGTTKPYVEDIISRIFAEEVVVPGGTEPALEEADSNLIFYHPSAFVHSRVILIVDNRETANTRKFKQMCDLFQRKGIYYEMRSLSVGDYLWILRMHDGKEMVLDYIAERKTHGDLWQSIRQKRYEEQKQRMMSAGIPNVVYILEGSVLPDPALEQALVTTHVENRFLVYRTNNIEHTSLFLAKITERLGRRAREREMSVQKASLVTDRFPSFAALTNLYSSIPKEQRATVLSENVPGITKGISATMAKFFAEV